MSLIQQKPTLISGYFSNLKMYIKCNAIKLNGRDAAAAVALVVAIINNNAVLCGVLEMHVFISLPNRSA